MHWYYIKKSRVHIITLINTLKIVNLNKIFQNALRNKSCLGEFLFFFFILVY